MQRLFSLVLTLSFAALPSLSNAATGREARMALNSFLKLTHDQALRMSSSIRFEPEFASCELVMLNSPEVLEVIVGRDGVQRTFEVSENGEGYDILPEANRLTVRTPQGFELALERRSPNRARDGIEISATLSQNGVLLLYSLIVR